jgi:predicted secreted protein
MPVGTAFAIYFLIWWVTLFAVLPWGVRNQEEAGEVVPGTDPGAPATHRLGRKLLWPCSSLMSVPILDCFWLGDRGGGD